MNVYKLLASRTLAVLVLIILITNGCTANGSSDLTKIRIGWQTTWATQGQIVQTMAHTNVLEKNGLSASYLGVTYGAPLNEAALAGNVDVIFTADQPAATLIAKDSNWVIIGRLMFNRVGIYVPPESSIHEIADLKGKIIAVPYGAAAQRIALRVMGEADINTQNDIQLVNLDITEQVNVVKRGSRFSWGEIDAMAGFDPVLAMLETNNDARMLFIDKVVSVIVMSKTYINTHPDAPVQFLKAFIESVYFYSRNPELANAWFRDASQLSFDDNILSLAASVEPNLNAKNITDIEIVLSPRLIEQLQGTADFIFANGLSQKHIDIENNIDQSFALIAKKSLQDGMYDPKSVIVIEK